MSLPDATLNQPEVDPMASTEAALLDKIERSSAEIAAAEAVESSLFGQLTTPNFQDAGITGLEAAAQDLLGVNFQDNLFTQVTQQAAIEQAKYTNTFQQTAADLTNVDTDPTSVTGRSRGGPPRTSCEAGIVSGLVQTAFGAATLATADVAKAARSVQLLVTQTVGSNTPVGQAMAGAMFNETITRLIIALRTRGTTIDSLSQQIENINNTIRGIDAAVRSGQQVYEEDNEAVLLTVQGLLQTSDSNLLALENAALAGAGIPAEEFIEEEDRIREAVDALSHLSDPLAPGFVGIRLRVTLMAQRRLFEAAVRSLRDSHLAFDILYKNVKNFTSSLSAAKAPPSPNLVTPLLRQIRCRVARVLDEIREVRRNGTVIDYIAGRAKWTVELGALLGISAAAREILRDNPDPSLSTSDTINAAISAVETGLGSLDELVRAERKIESILNLANVYTADLVRKSSRDVESEDIIERGERMIALLDEVAEETPAAFDLLNQWTGDGEVSAAIRDAVPIVGGLVTYYRSAGYDNIAEALQDGSIDTLIALIPGEASSAQQAVRQIASILGDPAVADTTKAAARRLKRFVDDEAEEEEIREVFVANRAARERDEQKTIFVPDYQSLLADVKTVRTGTGGTGFIAPLRVPPQTARNQVAIPTNQPSAVELAQGSWAG